MATTFRIPWNRSQFQSELLACATTQAKEAMVCRKSRGMAHLNAKKLAQ